MVTNAVMHNALSLTTTYLIFVLSNGEPPTVAGQFAMF